MFTGIVTGLGRIQKTEKNKNLKTVTIEAPASWVFRLGESVSVEGICSTVIQSKKNIFQIEYMKETLDKTIADFFQKNREVNLEKSLKVGDTLDGHFVYGHIDTLGEILQVSIFDFQTTLKIKLPKEFLKYVIYKGSIAINGASLTVSKVGKDYFEVSLIPHTLNHTTLKNLKKGDKVNIETDVIAKYAHSIRN